MTEIKGNFGKVIIGDCLKVLKPYVDKCIDLAFTDTKFNVEFEGTKERGDEHKPYNDNMTLDEYKSWCTNWFNELKRITNSQIIFCGNPNLAMWCKIQEPDDFGFHYKANCRSYGRAYYLLRHDIFLVYGKLKKRLSESVIKQAIGAGPTRENVDRHPCPAPLKLYRKMLSQINPTSVLDCFMGSGTTASACESLGIQYLGVEIDPYYIPDIEKRIQDGISYYKRNKKRAVKGLRGYK